MNILSAGEKDLKALTELVQTTILQIYPQYYPEEVVSFFSSLHQPEKIIEDIRNGSVWMLEDGGVLKGTGTLAGNHITRVFVLPGHQNQGCGSRLMDFLEERAALEYGKAVLDASLPACGLYEKRGYRTVTHGKWEVENGRILVYEIMEKLLANLK